MQNFDAEMEEKQSQIAIKVSDLAVYSDRHGLDFLVGQIISNSIKYSAVCNPLKLEVQAVRTGEHHILEIRDNGTGVRG